MIGCFSQINYSLSYIKPKIFPQNQYQFVSEIRVARHRTAATGAGIIPWHIDFDQMEEDLFHLLIAPPARAGALTSSTRSVSLAGAQILAAARKGPVARALEEPRTESAEYSKQYTQSNPKMDSKPHIS